MTSDNIFGELEEAVQVETNQEQHEPVEVTSFESARTVFLDALRNQALALQNDANLDLSEADIRFSTALNLRHIREALVCIIGAGGLGNWQWRILVAMGFKRIAIYDDDVVNIENVGSQAHSIFDIGLPKVDAVANAALQYRGLQILARKRRVETFHDIVDDLGEIPTIAIGCTDSADFRNGFIRALFEDPYHHAYPELFLDFRMSLGDWVCYLTPVKAIHGLDDRVALNQYYGWYTGEACFPPEQALQEPCTARGIAYTGANAASYTGAVLHWYYSGGKTKLADAVYLKQFLSNTKDDNEITRKVSFSARDWEFITETRITRKLHKKLVALKQNIENGLVSDFLHLYNFQYDDLVYDHLDDVQLNLLLEECDLNLVGAYIIPLQLNKPVMYALILEHETSEWYGVSLEYESKRDEFVINTDQALSQSELMKLCRHHLMVVVKQEIPQEVFSLVIQQPLGKIFTTSWNPPDYIRLSIKDNRFSVETLHDGKVHHVTDGGNFTVRGIEPDNPDYIIDNGAYSKRSLVLFNINWSRFICTQVSDSVQQHIEGWFKKFDTSSAQVSTESEHADIDSDEVWVRVNISENKLVVGDIICLGVDRQQRFEIVAIADLRLQVKDLTNNDCFYLSRKIDSVVKLVQNKE